MKKETLKLSALIITYNEIGYIENCIDSIRFVDEIIVVDSFSTDGTYEYLLSCPGVRVIQREFDNFTRQKTYALMQPRNDWVLFIDADEEVTEPLRAEIEQNLSAGTPHAAFWFPRQFMFGEQQLKYSGWQTDKNYRLFRRSKARFVENKIVHETLRVDGSSGIMKHKLIHRCYKNYQDYKAKMLTYGRMKAQEDFYSEKPFSYVHLFFKPFWKFFNHYFLRLGILDGSKGITICYLNALSDLERYRELRQLESKNQITHYLRMP